MRRRPAFCPGSQHAPSLLQSYQPQGFMTLVSGSNAAMAMKQRGPRFPLTSKLLPPASRDLRCFSWCAVPSLPQIGKECLKCYQTHPYEALNNERLPTGVRRMATGLSWQELTNWASAVPASLPDSGRSQARYSNPLTAVGFCLYCSFFIRLERLRELPTPGRQPRPVKPSSVRVG